MNYRTYSTESWRLISSKQQWIYSYHLIPWYILQSRPSRSTVGCLTPLLSWCHSNPSLLLQLWNLAFQSWLNCFAATYPKVNWILIPSICCCICRATNVEGAWCAITPCFQIYYVDVEAGQYSIFSQFLTHGTDVAIWIIKEINFGRRWVKQCVKVMYRFGRDTVRNQLIMGNMYILTNSTLPSNYSAPLYSMGWGDCIGVEVHICMCRVGQSGMQWSWWLMQFVYLRWTRNIFLCIET